MHCPWALFRETTLIIDKGYVGCKLSWLVNVKQLGSSRVHARGIVGDSGGLSKNFGLGGASFATPLRGSRSDKNIIAKLAIRSFVL